jgi:hypothetical protein
MTIKASEYLKQCQYRKRCNVSKASPWGFTHSRTAEFNGKRILVVGLNANESNLDIGNPSRIQYSKFLKGLIDRSSTVIGKYCGQKASKLPKLLMVAFSEGRKA